MPEPGHAPIAALDGVRIVVVLAGGNALGAYQAGVLEALLEHGIEPEWVIGASVGAINGAIAAGNPPEKRLAALKDFWRPAQDAHGWPTWWDVVPDTVRRSAAATGTLLTGRAGMFAPIGTALGNDAPALYDNLPMEQTLAGLLDFARLNAGSIRYTATAVDLESGDDAVFDTQTMSVTARHVRASTALPPSFRPVRIEERTYVDGGLSANLPLDPVLGEPSDRPTLCIAVDLLPLAGPHPATLGEVASRVQDLIFAAQSRRTIDRWRAVYAVGGTFADRSVTLVRLTYADQSDEVAGKAMDFSPASVGKRWTAGRHDAGALIAWLRDGHVIVPDNGLTVVQLPTDLPD